MFAQNLHSAYFLNSSISMRLFFWIHLYLNLFQHLSFHTLFHLVHCEVHNEINRCTSCQKGHKIMRQKCSPELAFRSTDICAPENLIFSALSTQPWYSHNFLVTWIYKNKKNTHINTNKQAKNLIALNAKETNKWKIKVRTHMKTNLLQIHANIFNIVY